MPSLPIIDRYIKRASVTDLNRMKREELKQALSEGTVFVLLADRREDIGVVMGLDTYQQLTRDLHPMREAPPAPVAPDFQITAKPPAEADVNEGLDLPWR